MRHILLLFLSLTFGSINTTIAQSLAGHVYIMTEHLGDGECWILLECDCCSADIFFLTEKEFVMVDRCIHNESYYKGTYTTNKDNLVLNFDQFAVNETYNDVTEETKLEKRNQKIAGKILYNNLQCK